jgi:hypothetical protein
MKKISVALVTVLLCTAVFAFGTDESSSSSVEVTNCSGSSLYKVYYSSQTPSDVKVTILDNSGKILFTERIRKTDGFIRPYNFQGMKEGEYFISVESIRNSYSKKVTYNGGRIDKVINLVKISDEGKFLLSARSKGQDKISVNVYNQLNELVFSKESVIAGEFAQVYNLKNKKGFTIEITDSKGILKTVNY